MEQPGGGGGLWSSRLLWSSLVVEEGRVWSSLVVGVEPRLGARGDVPVYNLAGGDVRGYHLAVEGQEASL